MNDITITDLAKQSVVKFLDENNSNSKYVRVGVRGGGCSGLQYVLEVGILQENDFLFPVNENGYAIIIDLKSLVFLKGVVLDYKKGLMDAGFKFVHPKLVKTCGCGESFVV